MALPVSKILADQFMSLEGTIEPPAGMLDFDQRGGVEGTEIGYDGKKGKLFTLKSRVDCASYIDGLFQYKLYKDGYLNGAVGAVQVVQSGFDTQAFGFVCKVMDIRIISCERTPVIVGGLQYTSGAILTCEWDLISFLM